MSTFRTLAALVAIAVLAAGASAQMTQTLPMGWDMTDGNGATSFPQNNTADHIWQWHYDSSQFVHMGPILITEVRVRASSPTTVVSAFDFTNFTVTLCEASTDYTVGMHDPIFANNILTSAVVRTGQWMGPSVPASTGATATWIPMGLTGSFIYDPTTGNDFIIQIEKCGTVATWGATMDGASGTAGVNGGNRYGDTASCTATTSTFNNNEFVPIVQIDYVPAAVEPARVDFTPGSPLVFDSMNSTYSGTAVVSSYTTPFGITETDPANDPLIGTVVSFSGGFAGTDLTGFSDLIMTPANIDIVVAPGADELHIINQMTALSGGGVFGILAGGLDCIPMNVREIRQTAPSNVTRVGSGSAALDGWSTVLGGSTLSLLMRLDPGGPTIHSLQRDYTFVATVPDSNFATDSTGQVQLGCIGLSPGAELYNIFSLNPVVSQGGGPFFGLEFGTFQIEQILLPVGSAPIHDTVASDGTYFWGAPAGTVGMGTVVDLVTIELPMGSSTFGYISNVKRVTF